MAEVPPPPLGGAGTRKRKRAAVDLGANFQCPCCYRPGSPFCDSCEPEDAAKKLVGLRALLAAHGLDAYIIGSQDAHASEYIAEADQRRSYLTGFAGSAGTAVVTASKSLLWTDSRYFLEAEERLKGTDWVLMRQFEPGVPELHAWVLQHLAGKTVGFDPTLVPAETAQEWRGKWSDKVLTKPVPVNLVDAIWAGRPDVPSRPVEVHPLEYAGATVAEKLERVRTACKESGAEALILSALDQIAWLFNLRGSDIECNPVFFSYAVMTESRALLFVRALDEAQTGLGAEVKKHLESAGVTTRPYGMFFEEAPAALQGKRVMMELSSCSVAILELVPVNLRVTCQSPVDRFKAEKNAQEIQGLRSACQRDSAAICAFLSALQRRILAGEQVTEMDASNLISEMRRRQPLYVGDSFPTISSSGPNAAIIHYRPRPGDCRTLDKAEIYLVDTGGQYKDGTTDVTRTWHWGEPTAEQRRCYTRVLQGHVGLATAVFPEGTPGLYLDAFARQPLWKDGLQYGHGTGHGIGAYLNVHEGPMGIGGGTVPGSTIQGSDRMRRVYLEPIMAGHFLSDEPGFYKNGEFGVRLESDLVAVPAKTRYGTGGRPWLKFECLTLVPFCRSLLDPALLTPEEVHWLDDYHAKVWATLESALEGVAKEWLREATVPVCPQAPPA